MAQRDVCLKMGLEMTQCKADLSSCLEKKRRKKRKRSCNYVESDVSDDNFPKVTSSINISPVQIESFLHPPVSTGSSVAMEITQHDPEVVIFQDMDKGMEQNKIHNALKSIDSNQDLHESGNKPIRSLASSVCVERASDNYVSEVAEHDDHSLVDIISLEVGNIQTYQRKKRVKTYRRRKRDLSNSLTSSLVSTKHGADSSVLVVQGTSVQNSNEAPASGHSEKMSGEVVAEYGTALLGAGSISRRRASGERPGGELESGGQEKKMKMENLKEIINEQSVVQDIDTVKENFDKFTTFYKKDKASASSGSDPSVENMESDNFEIRPKMRDPISSSSQLGEMTDDVSIAVISKDGPQQMLQSANGAAAGKLRKKLLVLDVNGILADIVSCASERYKPDTIISRKAVFRRPFCDDFLQFCFERFRVGVWSSRTKRNVESVLDFLMGKFKCDLLFCWDQLHCTDTGFNTVENRDKPLLLKELKKLWEKHEPDLPWEKGEFNESNTLLLDDSPYKALRNPMHTAIFPHSYRYKNVKDNSLGPGGDLRVYLEGLASADNVQTYVELNPFGQRPIRKTNLSWAFYLKVIGTASSSQQEEDANNSSACEQKLAD